MLILCLIPSSIALWVAPSRTGVIVAAGGVTALLYLLFSDAVGAGASPGRRLSGIRIVDAASGKHPPSAKCVLRAACLLLGPLDWLAIAGKRRRRLGDRFAGTDVVNH
jgi:uncharacterized RDD family membrane protein YckC